MLHGLQNKLKIMQQPLTYYDINKFLFNFRKWLNNYSEMISKKNYITGYHTDNDTFLNLSTFLKNFYSKHEDDDGTNSISCIIK